MEAVVADSPVERLAEGDSQGAVARQVCSREDGRLGDVAFHGYLDRPRVGRIDDLSNDAADGDSHVVGSRRDALAGLDGQGPVYHRKVGIVDHIGRVLAV